MNKLRWIFAAAGVFAVTLIVGQPGQASFVQTQRDQISVYVLVNVTPGPLSYAPAAPPDASGIDVRMAARGKGSELLADAQQALRVQAEVSPNPNATLLYSNSAAVTLNATAGTTVTSPSCVYTVTVHPLPTTSWTLDDGLSADFSTAFPGKSLSNNSYLQSGSPNPTFTPFVVYPNNNNAWYQFAKATGVQIYCVTLSVSVPATTPGGAYSTNAVYTLYY